MENQVFNYLNEVCNEIPHFFIDDTIKKHLDAFAIWNDFEWFNIALILYQKPNATFVNSLNAWEKILDKNFYIKKGERGIKVVIPELNDNSFKWNTVIVWDIDQCQEHHMVGNISELRTCVEILFQNGIIEGIQNKEEIMNYIRKATKNMLPKSILSKQNVVDYVYKCMEYILSDYLPIEYEEINLTFQTKELSITEYINLYIILKNIISELARIITDFYIQKKSREKKDKELEWAKRINSMNIMQRVEEARQFMIRKKEKNVENYDFDALENQKSHSLNIKG